MVLHRPPLHHRSVCVCVCLSVSCPFILNPLSSKRGLRAGRCYTKKNKKNKTASPWILFCLSNLMVMRERVKTKQSPPKTSLITPKLQQSWGGGGRQAGLFRGEGGVVEWGLLSGSCCYKLIFAHTKAREKGAIETQLGARLLVVETPA